MATWEGDDWIPLQPDVITDKDPDKPGAYVIRCAPDGLPKIIGRAFCKDPTGVICFGQSTKVRGRLGMFRNNAENMGGAPHAEGKRYYDLHYACSGYPLESLEVRWVECETEGQAEEQESAWFREYVKHFGELPPLNRKQGK